MGEPRKSPDEALRTVPEAMEVIPALVEWGMLGPLRGRVLLPARGQARPQAGPRDRAWLGSMGPRMLRLTGELVDGWVAPLPSYRPYKRWGGSQERIDAGAEKAGRYPTPSRSGLAKTPSARRGASVRR